MLTIIKKNKDKKKFREPVNKAQSKAGKDCWSEKYGNIFNLLKFSKHNIKHAVELNRP